MVLGRLTGYDRQLDDVVDSRLEELCLDFGDNDCRRSKLGNSCPWRFENLIDRMNSMFGTVGLFQIPCFEGQSMCCFRSAGMKATSLRFPRKAKSPYPSMRCQRHPVMSSSESGEIDEQLHNPTLQWCCSANSRVQLSTSKSLPMTIYSSNPISFSHKFVLQLIIVARLPQAGGLHRNTPMYPSNSHTASTLPPSHWYLKPSRTVAGCTKKVF